MTKRETTPGMIVQNVRDIVEALSIACPTATEVMVTANPSTISFSACDMVGTYVAIYEDYINTVSFPPEFLEVLVPLDDLARRLSQHGTLDSIYLTVKTGYLHAFATTSPFDIRSEDLDCVDYEKSNYRRLKKNGPPHKPETGKVTVAVVVPYEEYMSIREPMKASKKKGASGNILITTSKETEKYLTFSYFEDLESCCEKSTQHYISITEDVCIIVPDDLLSAVDQYMESRDIYNQMVRIECDKSSLYISVDGFRMESKKYIAK